MIAAIEELAEKFYPSMNNCHTYTAQYLKACSFIFEYGILSHEKIESAESRPLSNMTEGMKWFCAWKEELQSEPGSYPCPCTCFIGIIYYLFLL